MSETFKDIIDEIYTLLGEDQTSTIFDKEKVIKPEINKYILKVCKGEIINTITNLPIRAGMLPFLHEEEIVYIPQRKTLILKANEGDIELFLSDVDGMNMNGGYVLIFGMFLEYRDINSTTNGVLLKDQLPKTVKQGEDVRIVIKKDIKTIKPRDIREYTTNRKLVYYDFQDIPLNTNTSYTIHPYQKDEFIIFDNFMGEVIIPTILKPKEMKEETDECILPDNYGTLVVAPLVAGEQLKIDKQFQLGNDILLAAYNNLTEMYNFYCKPVEERKPKVKVRPMLLDVP